MEYVRLGNTGLRVSRIALGCMSYGARGFHEWTLDEEESQPFFRQAVELGITLWDTANGYGGGTSEEFVGRAMRRFARREDIVVATKVYNKMHDGPGGSGLSRKAILEQLDASLSRLGTDYIDLYYIHRFDPDVPVEETMTALHDVVKAGKVRYLGASSMWAWQFAKLQHAADRTAGPVSWPWRTSTTCSNAKRSGKCCPCVPTWASAASRTHRSVKVASLDPGVPRLNAAASIRSRRVSISTSINRWSRRCSESPRQRGVPMAHIAMAWLLSKPVVASPIVGATKPHHLPDAAAALEVHLTEEEIHGLEQPYTTQPAYWW